MAGDVLNEGFLMRDLELVHKGLFGLESKISPRCLDLYLGFREQGMRGLSSDGPPDSLSDLQGVLTLALALAYDKPDVRVIIAVPATRMNWTTHKLKVIFTGLVILRKGDRAALQLLQDLFNRLHLTSHLSELDLVTDEWVTLGWDKATLPPLVQDLTI